MNLLALNFGTSTLKFALFARGRPQALAAGVVERPPPAQQALRDVMASVEDIAPVQCVAHRVVHGGMQSGPAFVDEKLERAIEAMVPLAPQHNRLALDGIRAARVLWPGVPHVALFDTAFHAAMPARAARYAVPEAWHEAGLRRYGFHGLSHQNVMEAVAVRMNAQPGSLRIVSCHLGNGASVCAIQDGRSVDTSMGLTPLEGLIMGTRCGDLDPGAAGYLARTLGLELPRIEQALYAESGLAALSGLDGDMRRIEAAAAAGDARAESAIDAYAYRVRKYIGAYAAAMERCDAVAFTAGVGQHSPSVRARVLGRMQFLGAVLDEAKNASPAMDPSGVAEVHRPESRVKLFVVEAREEHAMARQAWELIGARPR